MNVTPCLVRTYQGKPERAESDRALRTISSIRSLGIIHTGHSCLNRIPHQPRNVMNAQTLHQLGPVCLHGLYTDFQQMSDGLGAVAVANQLQDLPLAGCEGLCGDGFLGSEGPLHDLSANGGRQIVSARNDTLYSEV